MSPLRHRLLLLTGLGWWAPSCGVYCDCPTPPEEPYGTFTVTLTPDEAAFLMGATLTVADETLIIDYTDEGGLAWTATYAMIVDPG